MLTIRTLQDSKRKYINNTGYSKWS